VIFEQHVADHFSNELVLFLLKEAYTEFLTLGIEKREN
jgi:hypothetical protein